jgi:hypothetical protein
MIPAGGQLDTRYVKAAQQPSLTWKLDVERGRAMGMVNGLDAVKQAVFCILQTERFEYLIYASDHGFESRGLVGANPAIIRSELKRRITEALLQDDRITGVTNFDIEINGEHAAARFTVVSALGSFHQEVKISV